MTVYTKPLVKPAWGESKTTPADMITPTDPEIGIGWPLSAVPPSRQRFNWVLNYASNAVRYLMQRGLVEWDAAETYSLHSKVTGPDGLSYKSLQAANIGNTPDSAPSFWERWGFSDSELSSRFVARDAKESVIAATTANITLSAPQTIDGIAVVAGNRVLVKNQAAGAENGIYVVAAGAWTRATDAVTGTLSSGATVPVTSGTVNNDTEWMLSTNDPIVVGTTVLSFVSNDSRYAKINGDGGQNFSAASFTTGGALKVGNGATILILQSDVEASVVNLANNAQRPIRIANGTDPDHAATVAQLSTAGKAIGELFEFAGTAAPAGSLICPTAATNISRTTYAALFAAIGTTWGVGDGSTTFGMPWFPANYSSVQASANVGTQTVGDNLAHTHGGAIIKTSDFSYGGGGSIYAIGNGGNVSTTGSAANFPAGVRVLKCVKY